MNKDKKLVKFIDEDGEVITYIGNKQVKYMLLLHKKNINKSKNNVVEDYDVVEPFIGMVNYNNKYVKDYFSGSKYKYCQIANVDNQRIVTENDKRDNSFTLNEEYIAVNFMSYYYELIDEYAADAINNVKVDNKDVIKNIVAGYFIFDKMSEQIEKLQDQKTRVRK